jgi:hypothetical protein
VAFMINSADHRLVVLHFFGFASYDWDTQLARLSHVIVLGSSCLQGKTRQRLRLH